MSSTHELTATELIDWFEEEFEKNQLKGTMRVRPSSRAIDGVVRKHYSLCQCATAELITCCSDPDRMRIFLLVAHGISLAISYDPSENSDIDYSAFRRKFWSLGIIGHGTPAYGPFPPIDPLTLAPPAWTANSSTKHQRFPQTMDWESGVKIADILLSEVSRWLLESPKGEDRWADLARALYRLPEAFEQYDREAGLAVRELLER